MPFVHNLPDKICFFASLLSSFDSFALCKFLQNVYKTPFLFCLKITFPPQTGHFPLAISSLIFVLSISLIVSFQVIHNFFPLCARVYYSYLFIFRVQFLHRSGVQNLHQSVNNFPSYQQGCKKIFPKLRDWNSNNNYCSPAYSFR